MLKILTTFIYGEDRKRKEREEGKKEGREKRRVKKNILK